MVRIHPGAVTSIAGGMGGIGEVGGGGFEIAGAGGGTQDFGAMLDAAVRGVDTKQNEADTMMRGLATGENVDIHGTMIALEEANISIRAMGSIRDKLVDGFQNIWNMPV